MNKLFNPLAQQKMVHHQKMTSLLHRTIALALKLRLKHVPGLKAVTINKVLMSPDRHLANIYYSTWDFKKKFAINRALSKNIPLLRKMICDQLKLKKSPFLKFIFDEHLVNADRVDHLISKHT